MDDFGGSNLGNQNLNKPISSRDDPEKAIPFDDSNPGGTSVSRSPLNLGGGGSAQAPNTGASKPAASKPVASKPAQAAASSGRITGVKTFFTKLHPGAIEFLDEQITGWLKANPGIVIKQTDAITGEIQAKKTEPNIIITVWY